MKTIQLSLAIFTACVTLIAFIGGFFKPHCFFTAMAGAMITTGFYHSYNELKINEKGENL